MQFVSGCIQPDTLMAGSSGTTGVFIRSELLTRSTNVSLLLPPQLGRRHQISRHIPVRGILDRSFSGEISEVRLIEVVDSLFAFYAQACANRSTAELLHLTQAVEARGAGGDIGDVEVTTTLAG